MRDAQFFRHAKPNDVEQAAVWINLVEYTLEPPDTWEVDLSAGKDKRENFKRLLPHRSEIRTTSSVDNPLSWFLEQVNVRTSCSIRSVRTSNREIPCWTSTSKAG